MPKVRLSDWLPGYLDGMRTATTAVELEAAIQARHDHPWHGPTWKKICQVRIEAGYRICDAHPNGRFVPRLGYRHKLTVCGENYKVGYGQNSTGVRYCWHYAKEWAMDVLRRNGMTVVASHRIWDHCLDYPHRCLAIVEAALAGKIPDPELNVLIRHKLMPGMNPVNYTVEQNDASTYDRRATKPCPTCGGTLFDWGAGFSEGFVFITWRCNGCPDVFTEYMTSQQLYLLRQQKRLSSNAIDPK